MNVAILNVEHNIYFDDCFSFAFNVTRANTQEQGRSLGSEADGPERKDRHKKQCRGNVK